MAEEAKKSRGAWFREMKSELKKVTWPNQKTVVKNTGTVLLCSLLIGACILKGPLLSGCVLVTPS